MNWNEEVDIDVLKGKTLKAIVRDGDRSITFVVDDGTRYRMFHDQDCCESVLIDDVVGDLQDLVGEPIFMAEQVSSDDRGSLKGKEHADSYTWTFYKLATRKGFVDIRWYGESNGYYSESVEIEKEAQDGQSETEAE